jgi:hypothetical protein
MQNQQSEGLEKLCSAAEEMGSGESVPADSIDIDVDGEIDDYINFHLGDDDDDDDDEGNIDMSMIDSGTYERFDKPNTEPQSYNMTQCVNCHKLSRILHEMKDYILRHNHYWETDEPVCVFPMSIVKYWDLKSEIRRYRGLFHRPSSCTCDTHPRFHGQTGKCSVLVIALSFAYHTSNMCDVRTDHDEIIITMEKNYQNFCEHVKKKKDSVMKEVMTSKMKRYDIVLPYNRKMYTSPSPY